MTVHFTKYLNTCDKVCVSSETVYSVLAYFHRNTEQGQQFQLLTICGARASMKRFRKLMSIFLSTFPESHKATFYVS